METTRRRGSSLFGVTTHAFARGFLMSLAVLLFVATDALAAARVSVNSDFFSPVNKRVARGRVVRWVNNSGDLHSVTAYGRRWSKDSLVHGDGGSTRKRFRRIGVYRYRCKFHSELQSGECSGMCAAVRVVRPKRSSTARAPVKGAT